MVAVKKFQISTFVSFTFLKKCIMFWTLCARNTCTLIDIETFIIMNLISLYVIGSIYSLAIYYKNSWNTIMGKQRLTTPAGIYLFDCLRYELKIMLPWECRQSMSQYYPELYIIQNNPTGSFYKKSMLKSTLTTLNSALIHIVNCSLLWYLWFSLPIKWKHIRIH